MSEFTRGRDRAPRAGVALLPTASARGRRKRPAARFPCRNAL